jgi:hypothetical protein
MTGALSCGISTSDTTLARLTRQTVQRTRSALSRLVGAALSPTFTKRPEAPVPRGIVQRHGLCTPVSVTPPGSWAARTSRSRNAPLRGLRTRTCLGSDLARGVPWPGCPYSDGAGRGSTKPFFALPRRIRAAGLRWIPRDSAGRFPPNFHPPRVHSGNPRHRHHAAFCSRSASSFAAIVAPL